jgi:hypothetical protein
VPDVTFPLDILTEARVGGQWVPMRTYDRDTVEIEHGRGDGASETDPGRLAITVDNRSGQWSPRNASGPHYGKIGRNTRVRLSVPGTESYLELDGSTGTATTPDDPSLDITGALDLRWEGEADWYGVDPMFLMGKWGDRLDRSFHLRLEDGYLWCSTFINTGNSFYAGFKLLPALPRRAALRVTVTVAGGSVTYRFYWAESITGPWTQIGDPESIGTDVTNLFASTAPLQITPPLQTDVTPNRQPLTGRVYRAEVRNGIDGPVVANPDFTAQTAGATSFTDSAGRPWTVTAPATIRDRQDLFVGEVSEWPQHWTSDESDAWVPLEASGILRRMGQGRKALQSTLRRSIPTFSPLAYWPLEEGASATQAYSPIAGVPPLTLTNVDWASTDSLPSSEALPVLKSRPGNLPMMQGRVPAPGTALPGWAVNMLYYLDKAPTTMRTFLRILSTGSVAEWYLQMSATGSRVLGRDSDGTTVVDQLITPDEFGIWVRLQFNVEQSGSTVNWRINWYTIGGEAGGFGASYTGSVGRPTAVTSPPDGYSADLDGMAIGHISVWPTRTTWGYTGAIDAWTGETAWARMRRLCSEERVPLACVPGPEVTQQVGYQRPDTLLALLQQAADADGGLLLEDRTRLGLLYRERSSMYSQDPKLTLSYNRAPGLAAPLEPTDDDTDVRNDRTVQRDGGSAGRAVLEEGTLSVQDPPDGIGLYDDSVTLSLHSDDQAEPIAYWRLHLGTVDEPRYPQVRILLHKAPHLIPVVSRLVEGDVARITDLPAYVGRGHTDLLVTGIRHEMSLTQWTAILTTEPAAPWRVGITGDAEHGRVDANPGGSVLALPSTATDNQLLVHTPARGPMGPAPWITSAGPAPTYPGEFPFDIAVGGETARVTACVPAAWDSFGRAMTSGWGVADCGFTWGLSSGLLAERTVSSNMGIVTLSSTPTTVRGQRILSQQTDGEFLVRVSVDQLATGAALVPAVLLRYTSLTDFYQARVHFAPGGAMQASIARGTTTVGSVASLPYTYTAGQWFRVRARITGHRVQLRVWPVGDQEPAVWHADQTVTTSPIPSGQVGVAAAALSGNTNVSPGLRFDDFETPTPQLLTVERSTNGVVKAHAAGAEVRLAQPAVTAL